MTQSNSGNPPPGNVPPTPTPYAPPPSNNLGGAMPVMGLAPDQDSRTMGMLCHLLGIFTGFLGPLIIWLIKKDTSPWVDDQGKEALNFQLAALIATLICIPLNFVFCLGLVLMVAVQITRLVFSIIATVKANEGIAYRYPITLRLIR